MAHLIERHPGRYLRLKGLGDHRLARDPEFLRLHARLVRAGDCLQVLPERHNLWVLARLAAERAGAFAEVGVYRGGSAEIIAAAKGAAPLHLFDTFTGMPDVNPATDGAFKAGDFADGPIAAVRARLARFSGVSFYPGVFPASAATLPAGMVFQFVHLDVDLHQSTLEALHYFYPRLAPGGLLVTHDYDNFTVPGVKQAFDEFLRDRAERVTPLWQTQGLLVKQPPRR